MNGPSLVIHETTLFVSCKMWNMPVITCSFYPLALLQKAESTFVEPNQPSRSPHWPKPNGVGGCLDIRELTPHYSGDSNLVGLCCFDLQRSFIHIAPFYLPVLASQAIWHPCLETWGSPTARSFYVNQGFLHRLCSQLGLFLPAPCFWWCSIPLLFHRGVQKE